MRASNRKSRSGTKRIPSPTLLALPLLAIASLQSQTTSSAVFSIRLEQKKGDVVKAVPQKAVFRNGDILRFRLGSQIEGYLYVLDRGTTGRDAVLFPAPNTSATGNRLEINRSYVVPAEGEGWFEVGGPTGFDILYFLVSASPINLPSSPSPQSGSEAPSAALAPEPSNLLPRCDDAIFRARGECVDASAGVAPLPPDAAIPRELIPLARTASRDIVLTDDGEDTAVQSAARFPLVYTFRLAHRE